MTARQTQSTPSDVGYCKPPRHTQFRKGQSGNPGGRPRREPVERLKVLTLQEAYRGVVIKENGAAVPVQAVQAILRSQVELAMNGNVRAQRDILSAVRAYERADAEAATVDAYVEGLVQQAADLEEVIEAAKRAAPTVEKKMSYVDAARRICFLLGLGKPRSEAKSEAAENEACAPGEETVTVDAERNAAAAPSSDIAPPADRAPQPESDTAPAAPPVASPPPFSPLQAGEGREGVADPPGVPAAGPRLRRSRHDRYARHPARESTPSAGRDVRAGRVHNRLLRNRCLHRRTGDCAPPFIVTWKQVTSRYSRRQKSGNSLLDSLFSGNAGAGRAESAPATTGRWR
jgi:hypothetical protein